MFRFAGVAISPGVFSSAMVTPRCRREQRQVFEGAEGRVQRRFVGNIARPGHMLDAVAERNLFDHIQSALISSTASWAPQPLGIGNRERHATFTAEMEIASDGRVDRVQREIISRKPGS